MFGDGPLLVGCKPLILKASLPLPSLEPAPELRGLLGSFLGAYKNRLKVGLGEEISCEDDFPWIFFTRGT